MTTPTPEAMSAEYRRGYDDGVRAGKLSESGTIAALREQVAAQSNAADMIAEERDAWEKRAKALEAEMKMQEEVLTGFFKVAMDRAEKAEADNAALRQLLADMKPYWVGATRGSFSRELVALNERINAAMLAGKKP